jgi:hypothetical protein
LAEARERTPDRLGDHERDAVANAARAVVEASVEINAREKGAVAEIAEGNADAGGSAVA